MCYWTWHPECYTVKELGFDYQNGVANTDNITGIFRGNECWLRYSHIFSEIVWEFAGHDLGCRWIPDVCPKIQDFCWGVIHPFLVHVMIPPSFYIKTSIPARVNWYSLTIFQKRVVLPQSGFTEKSVQKMFSACVQSCKEMVWLGIKNQCVTWRGLENCKYCAVVMI